MSRVISGMVSDSKLEDLVNQYQRPWINYNFEDLPVWVIGDVHGCATPYEELLNKILSETPYCYIYQLGDLIDRGPDLLEVFQLTDHFNVITTIGNHELKFMQEHIVGVPCRSKARRVTHEQFAQLYPSDQEMILRMIMSSYNRAWVLSNGRWWNLSHSTPTQAQATDGDYSMGAAPLCMGSDGHSDDSFLLNYVHGHKHWEYVDIRDQVKRAQELRYVFNIDSGCVYGKHLTALELSSLQFIQVEGVDYASENE